ncbi:PASTA domain-containing protein [Streptosporangium sp. NPDC051023]|uniref:serine/threonine-protein kinase n=1 Tax=Streptosporangium sp. NPDC051023 TaxID=3155410 RepID=UPI00344FB923
MPYAQPLKAGDPETLGGYDLLGRLGEGGQGVVYLGTRPATGSEPYALKLLRTPPAEDPALFLREVELAKQVARFCLAQVIDAGLDGDRPYIVSEYVEGPSLQSEVTVGGPRRGGALERLAIGTATALAAIHRAGIVHRDFKPQNVLLGPDGPRVIDFGLARALDPGATQSGRGAGTPAYMAPEQVEGTEIDPAADVFSWGATMCFAANAQAPFGQDSVAAVLHRILTAPPRLGSLGGRLGALVGACLEKDARNRPTSRELLLALLEGEDGEGAPIGHDGRDGRTAVFQPASAALVRESSVREASVRESSVREASVRESSVRGVSMREASVWESSSPEASEEPSEPRFRRGGTVARVSVAVSGALLVSTAVLVGTLTPALSGGDRDGKSRRIGPAADLGVREGPTPGPGGAPRTTHPAPGPGVGTTVPAPPPSRSGSKIRVPVLAGLNRSQALRLIRRAGLSAGEFTSADSDQLVGRVLRSWPQALTRVKRGTRIDLEVSAGVRVPALAGLRRASAERMLAQAKLIAGKIVTRCSGQQGGQVLTSAPAPGTHVSPGSEVTLVVSRPGAEVPSLVGRNRRDARDALAAAGLAVAERSRSVDDPSQAGTVLAQSVAPGGCVGPDTTVVITVGSEEQGEPEPARPTVPPDAPDPDGTDSQDGPAQIDGVSAVRWPD